jgi:single-strand DNA-binding protein
MELAFFPLRRARHPQHLPRRGDRKMSDMNKIILIGRLGADPVHRETKDGLSVVHFSLATSRRTAETSDTTGEPKKETEWHRVVVWGKQGEICSQYLRKGDQVYVEGSVRTRRYAGKDGTERMAFEVYSESVGFLGLRRKEDLSAAVVNEAASG